MNRVSFLLKKRCRLPVNITGRLWGRYTFVQITSWTTQLLRPIHFSNNKAKKNVKIMFSFSQTYLHFSFVTHSLGYMQHTHQQNKKKEYEVVPSCHQVRVLGITWLQVWGHLHHPPSCLWLEPPNLASTYANPNKLDTYSRKVKKICMYSQEKEAGKEGRKDNLEC